MHYHIIYNPTISRVSSSRVVCAQLDFCILAGLFLFFWDCLGIVWFLDINSSLILFTDDCSNVCKFKSCNYGIMIIPVAWFTSSTTVISIFNCFSYQPMVLFSEQISIFNCISYQPMVLFSEHYNLLYRDYLPRIFKTIPVNNETVLPIIHGFQSRWLVIIRWYLCQAPV